MGKGVGMIADTEPRRLLVRSRATLNSSTPDVIAQRFRRNVRTEILRLLNHEHLAQISREEVERVGKESGLSSSEATHDFLGLKGMVWEGTTSRARDSEHLWDMVHFDVPWFQRRGDAPTS